VGKKPENKNRGGGVDTCLLVLKGEANVKGRKAWLKKFEKKKRVRKKRGGLENEGKRGTRQPFDKRDDCDQGKAGSGEFKKKIGERGWV